VGGDGDLSLKAVLETVLDPKGLDDLEAGLKRTSDNAKKAGAGAEESSGHFDKLGKRLPNAAFDILSKEMLQNVGIQSGLGPLTRVSTAAFESLAGGLGLTGSALAGITLGASLLIPILISLASHSDDSAQAADRQKDSADTLVSSYEKLIAKGVHLTKAQTDYLKLQRELQSEERIRAEDTIEAEIRAQDKLIQSTMSLWGATKLLVKGQYEYWVQGKAVLDLTSRMNQITDAARKEQERLGAELENLRKAHKAGASSIAEYNDKLAESADAAAEARKRANLLANQQIERQFQAFIDQEAKAEQLAAQRSRKAWADRQAAISSGLQKNESEAKKIAAEHARQVAEQKELTEQQLKDEESIRDAKFATANASFELLGAMFGKNKATAIAQAIMNTYEGATKAIAQGGVAGPALAAAVVVSGLAQVAQIEKQKSGFDDPVNDLLARDFGRKWAADFTREVGVGFASGLRDGTSGRGTVINQKTSIDRGTHIGTANFNGLSGTPNQALLDFERRRIRVARVENRTRRRST
jgi:hypothetical protein